ncbi:hypothetical protein [Brevundimonas sp. NIBR10]|uniref:hypothetical protein n=1 Tax=Brevundimonas sp. NIBR10 TaxID=3015997 RepID=UPI0022F14851|nr:hypothetical protein [Brevundimonas sp. NIBR10]
MLIDEICADIDRRLQGAKITFALVLWVPGQADNPKSVALSAPPASQAEAAKALRTVADAAEGARS